MRSSNGNEEEGKNHPSNLLSNNLLIYKRSFPRFESCSSESSVNGSSSVSDPWNPAVHDIDVTSYDSDRSVLSGSMLSYHSTLKDSSNVYHYFPVPTERAAERPTTTAASKDNTTATAAVSPMKARVLATPKVNTKMNSANYDRQLPQISPNDALNGIETPDANKALPNPPSTPAPMKQPRYSTSNILPNTPLNVSGLNSPGIDMTDEKKQKFKEEHMVTDRIDINVTWCPFILAAYQESSGNILLSYPDVNHNNTFYDKMASEVSLNYTGHEVKRVKPSIYERRPEHDMAFFIMPTDPYRAEHIDHKIALIPLAGDRKIQPGMARTPTKQLDWFIQTISKYKEIMKQDLNSMEVKNQFFKLTGLSNEWEQAKKDLQKTELKPSDKTADGNMTVMAEMRFFLRFCGDRKSKMPFRGMAWEGKHRNIGIIQDLIGQYFDKNTGIASTATTMNWDYFVHLNLIHEEDIPSESFQCVLQEMHASDPASKPKVWTESWSVDVYGFSDGIGSITEGVECMRAISKDASLKKLNSNKPHVFDEINSKILRPLKASLKANFITSAPRFGDVDEYFSGAFHTQQASSKRNKSAMDEENERSLYNYPTLFDHQQLKEYVLRPFDPQTNSNMRYLLASAPFTSSTITNSRDQNEGKNDK